MKAGAAAGRSAGAGLPGGAARAPLTTGTMAAGFLAAFLLFGLVAIALRGPYVDEFWTMVFADPALSMREAWRMWSSDRGHPVGYVLAMRGYAELVPQSVMAGRLFNLAPLALFLMVAGRACRAPGEREFVIPFALLSLSLFFAIERFADQRSYFTAAMLLASIVVLARSAFAGSGRRVDRVMLIVLAGAAGAVHYAMALAILAVLAAASLSHLAGRRRGPAIWTAAAAASTAIAIALSLANAAGYEDIPQPYTVSMASFALYLAVALLGAALANPLLSLLALREVAGAPSRWRGLARDWRAALATRRGGAVLALAFVVVGYALLNALTHILLIRQIMAVAFVAVAVIAAFCARLDLRRMAPAILGVSIASMAISTVLVARQSHFLAAVPYLRERQAGCDTYRVAARFPEEVVDYPAEENTRQRHRAIARGYAYVAARGLLRLEPERSRRPFDARCGGAVWIARLYLPPDADLREVLGKLGMPVGEAAARGARLRSFDGATVIDIPPSTRAD